MLNIFTGHFAIIEIVLTLPVSEQSAAYFDLIHLKIEQTILDGASPQPIERVQLSTGMTDYAIRSHHQGGVRLEVPLDVVYTAPALIPETGIGHPLPYPPDGLVTLSEKYRQGIIEERLEGKPPRT